MRLYTFDENNLVKLYEKYAENLEALISEFKERIDKELRGELEIGSCLSIFRVDLSVYTYNGQSFSRIASTKHSLGLEMDIKCCQEIRFETKTFINLKPMFFYSPVG